MKTKIMETKNTEQYHNAIQTVKRIKGFYSHVLLFIVVVTIVLLFSDQILLFFERALNVENKETLRWIKLNIWINSGIWAIVILVQGVLAFKYKFTFVKKWEEKQIQKILKEE